MNKPNRCRVIQSRKTNYSDPIVLKKGETVTIGEEYKEIRYVERLDLVQNTRKEMLGTISDH